MATIEKATILHEFGHLSGLWHEDLMAIEGYDSRKLSNVMSTAPAFCHAYDKNSIMSEAYRGTLLRQNQTQQIEIALSSGDIHALRCLYVYPLDGFQQHCNPSVEP